MMSILLLQAGLVLVNGNVHTLDPAAPHARVVAVKDDRIVYVGDDVEAAARSVPGARRVDLGGATVVPGLTDAHGHVAGLGLLAVRLDVVGTGSASEVAAA